MRELNKTEKHVLDFATEFGCGLPSWLRMQDGRLVRPKDLTPDESQEWMGYLDLYLQQRQYEFLKTIKKWITFAGVLLILSIAANIANVFLR